MPDPDLIQDAPQTAPDADQEAPEGWLFIPAIPQEDVPQQDVPQSGPDAEAPDPADALREPELFPAVYIRYSDEVELPAPIKTAFENFNAADENGEFRMGVISGAQEAMAVREQEDENMGRVMDATKMRDEVVAAISNQRYTRTLALKFNRSIEQELDEDLQEALRSGNRARIAEARETRDEYREFKAILQTQGADAASQYLARHDDVREVMAEAISETPLMAPDGRAVPSMGQDMRAAFSQPDNLVAALSPLQNDFGGAARGDVAAPVETGLDVGGQSYTRDFVA